MCMIRSLGSRSEREVMIIEDTAKWSSCLKTGLVCQRGTGKVCEKSLAENGVHRKLAFSIFIVCNKFLVKMTQFRV